MLFIYFTIPAYAIILRLEKDNALLIENLLLSAFTMAKLKNFHLSPNQKHKINQEIILVIFAFQVQGLDLILMKSLCVQDVKKFTVILLALSRSLMKNSTWVTFGTALHVLKFENETGQEGEIDDIIGLNLILLLTLSRKMVQLFEVWPGNNRFFFNRCITGPIRDLFANLVLYICLIAAIIPYMIFMFQEIWNLSPAIPLLLFLSILVTLFFFNLTSCSDPGIIPRRPFLEFDYHERFSKYLE